MWSLNPSIHGKELGLLEAELIRVLGRECSRWSPEQSVVLATSCNGLSGSCQKSGWMNFRLPSSSGIHPYDRPPAIQKIPCHSGWPPGVTPFSPFPSKNVLSGVGHESLNRLHVREERAPPVRSLPRSQACCFPEDPAAWPSGKAGAQPSESHQVGLSELLKQGALLGAWGPRVGPSQAYRGRAHDYLGACLLTSVCPLGRIGGEACFHCNCLVGGGYGGT